MRHVICALAALALLGSRPALASDVTVTLKDHQFTPQTIDVTVFDPVNVTIKNLDITAAEIGSNELKIDPILLNAGGEITLKLGPLNAGYYDLFDAFHNDTECHLLVR